MKPVENQVTIERDVVNGKTLAGWLDLMQFTVLLPQRLQEGAMVGRRTGYVLDQAGSRVTAAVAMDLFPQPIQQAAEVSFGEGPVQIAQVLDRLGEQLSGVQVAQGVGREVSDQSGAPVAVLQASLRVVGRVDAEVVAVRPIPGGGNFGRWQVADHQRLF